MSIRIDKEKTIQKERMVFKPNWEYIFEKFFEVLIYSTWTISSILLIQNPKNAISVYATIAVISLNALVLISWYYIYKLVKIKMPNPDKNRDLFIGMLKKRFPELQINDTGLNMVRSKKSTGLFSWGKSLTVLFDKNYIFINLVTVGRFETNSPFHSLSNYFKLKRIQKEFNTMIKVN